VKFGGLRFLEAAHVKDGRCFDDRRPCIAEVDLGGVKGCFEFGYRSLVAPAADPSPKLTVHDIAREERASAAYLYSLLRLPWLAPDITTVSMAEKPPQLTAKTLMRLTPRLSADWGEQRKLLGFR
jgi:hypothetical protein